MVAAVIGSVSLNSRERVEGTTLRGEKSVFECYFLTWCLLKETKTGSQSLNIRRCSIKV